MNSYNIMYKPNGKPITSTIIDGEDMEDANWRLIQSELGYITILKTTEIKTKELPVRSLKETPNWKTNKFKD